MDVNLAHKFHNRQSTNLCDPSWDIFVVIELLHLMWNAAYCPVVERAGRALCTVEVLWWLRRSTGEQLYRNRNLRFYRLIIKVKELTLIVGNPFTP